MRDRLPLMISCEFSSEWPDRGKIEQGVREGREENHEMNS